MLRLLIRDKKAEVEDRRLGIGTVLQGGAAGGAGLLSGALAGAVSEADYVVPQTAKVQQLSEESRAASQKVDNFIDLLAKKPDQKWLGIPRGSDFSKKMDQRLDSAMARHHEARRRLQYARKKLKRFKRLQPVSIAGSALLGGILPSVAIEAFRNRHHNKKADAERRRQQARRDTEEDPSDGQQQAGNYKKGTLHWKGLRIKIENPEGSTRSGTDSEGNSWETAFQHDYGYFSQTEGSDGDHVDVFVGPDLESELVVVINQNDPATGRFDEHKVVIGVTSEQEGKDIYRANYQSGWKGLGSAHTMSLQDFKKWLGEGNQAKPLRKTAVRREIKEIRAGNLSPEAIRRIAENNAGQRERLIGNLGAGGAQQADLVLLPEHGVAVRKYFFGGASPEEARQAEDYRLLKGLKKIQDREGGRAGFARVLGFDDSRGLSFHEFIEGKGLADEADRVALEGQRQIDAIEDELARLNDQRRGMEPGSARRRAIENRYRDLIVEKERINNRLYKEVPRMIEEAKVPPTDEATRTVDKLRRTWPRVFDYDAPQNVIRTPKGNVVIDISSGAVNATPTITYSTDPGYQYRPFKRAPESAASRSAAKGLGRRAALLGAGILGAGILGSYGMHKGLEAGKRALKNLGQEKTGFLLKRSPTMEKEALNALKARQMAKEVGLIPEGQWRWALRQLRDERGRPLKGRALQEAKERIGILPNNQYQRLKALQRKQRQGVEVGMVDGGGMVVGRTGNVELPASTARAHTHPGSGRIKAEQDARAEEGIRDRIRYYLEESGMREQLAKDPTAKAPSGVPLEEAFQELRRRKGVADTAVRESARQVPDRPGLLTSPSGSDQLSPELSRRLATIRNRPSTGWQLDQKQRQFEYKQIASGVGGDASALVFRHFGAKPHSIVAPHLEQEGVHALTSSGKGMRSVYFDRRPRKVRKAEGPVKTSSVLSTLNPHQERVNERLEKKGLFRGLLSSDDEEIDPLVDSFIKQRADEKDQLMDQVVDLMREETERYARKK